MSNKEKEELHARIEEWKKKYGEIYELEVEGEKYIVRKPGKPELSKFSNKLQTDLFGAGEQLVRDILISPGYEEYNQRIEKDPGLVLILGNTVTTFFGLTREGTLRKL